MFPKEMNRFPMEQVENLIVQYIMPNLWGELQVLSNLNQARFN